MGIIATLGTVVAALAAIKEIMNNVNDIIDSVDTTMKEVEELMQTLSDESEGSFKDSMVDACSWMLEKFDALVSALTQIVGAVLQAAEDNERTDSEGAALLRNVITR